MLVDITPIAKIDWESKGARAYSVPFTSDGYWARSRMPLFVASSGKPGKTIVAIGGTHGDEYEGPVALKNLVNTFDASKLVAGRLIVIPVFSVTAFFADQREAAADGINMNRAFPGKADGSLSFRMARFLTDEVLSRADVVIDIHSGGRGFQIVPTMSFHAVDDPGLKQQFKETAFLFGTPFTMIYTSSMGTGLLTEEAEKMGKITIGSELGFGASTDLDGVRWAGQGVLNVMRHYGLLDEPVEDLRLPNKWGDAQRLVQNIDIDTWVTSPIAGISEPLAPLGSYVTAGTPVARVHDFYRWDEPGIDIVADQDGYVLCRKFRAKTEQGDVVMVIAKEVD